MYFYVNVRGTLKDAPAEAKQKHDATVDKLWAKSKELGAVSHQAFLDPQDPKKFMALDTWDSMDAIQKFLADASNPAAEIAALFEGPPDIAIWSEADGWRKTSR